MKNEIKYDPKNDSFTFNGVLVNISTKDVMNFMSNSKNSDKLIISLIESKYKEIIRNSGINDILS